MKSFSKFHNPISSLASRSWPAFLAGVLLLLLFSSTNLHAQAVSRINGEVTDQAGAFIPDAKVTVTNVDTSVSQTTTTTSAGTYLIIDLIPGTYAVKIEKTGFKTFVSKNVTVVGGATSTVNATLEPGTAPYRLRALKREEQSAMNSVALHELYFGNLGGEGTCSADVLLRDADQIETIEHPEHAEHLPIRA